MSEQGDLTNTSRLAILHGAAGALEEAVAELGKAKASLAEARAAFGKAALGAGLTVSEALRLGFSLSPAEVLLIPAGLQAECPHPDRDGKHLVRIRLDTRARYCGACGAEGPS